MRKHFLDRPDTRQHRRSLHRHEDHFRVVRACHIAHAVDVTRRNHVVGRIAAGNCIRNPIDCFRLRFGRAQTRLGRAFGRENQLNAELEAANLSLTESLVNALDARDPYSAGHSVAVAVYSRDLASEIGLPAPEVQRVYLAGLLHERSTAPLSSSKATASTLPLRTAVISAV